MIINTSFTIIKGVIYDSAMDVNEAPIGLSRAVTNNPILQIIIHYMMKTYLKLFYGLATRHYLKASNAVHEHRLRCPALIYLSTNDAVANHVSSLKIIERWQNSGVQVLCKCWENSPHVSHLFKYPEEYEGFMDSFLKKINIL